MESSLHTVTAASGILPKSCWLPCEIQPWKRYKSDLERNRKEDESLRDLKEMEAAGDSLAKGEDFKHELAKLRSRVEKSDVEKNVEAEKKKKEIKRKLKRRRSKGRRKSLRGKGKVRKAQHRRKRRRKGGD